MTPDAGVPTAAWARYLAEHEERHLVELLDFLRIPSISALPEHRPDMERAAAWVAERLRAAGVPEVEVLPNPAGAPPVIYGRRQVGDGKPTVLIYAHYDTQPVDPLELWETPPFEPALRDGAVYARGASDDKGMLFATIAAVEALAAIGALPDLNLAFCFEGAEENFSGGLAELIRAERERFRCDVLVSADGLMHSRDRLSITISSKGGCALGVELRTADHDLHSGLYGATVPNAAQAIARLVTTLHDADGRVAVAGFYDDVRELTAEDRAEIAAIPFDPDAYLADTGATAFWGEPGYTPPERAGARPTLDVVGIGSGFTGEGIKTVTPCRATAKLTCRLVPNQDPERILDLLERHVRANSPPGATLATERFPGAAPFEIRRDDPGLKVAVDVLREMGGQEPLVVRIGGTLPIASVFQQELGVDMVFLAWEMPDARFHSPNEFLRLDDFRACIEGYCRYLPRLASVLA
jgi:acetylornithine deacetylase/succinyl-diaminopimelate desuccinylase-like protein